MNSFLERHLPEPIATLLILVIGFLIFPLVLPFMYVTIVLDELRLRSLVKRTACPSCGQVLGMDSLRLGREEKRSAESRARAGFWGARHCLTAHGAAPRVVCVWCGARHVYRDEHGLVDEAVSQRLG